MLELINISLYKLQNLKVPNLSVKSFCCESVRSPVNINTSTLRGIGYNFTCWRVTRTYQKLAYRMLSCYSAAQTSPTRWIEWALMIARSTLKLAYDEGANMVGLAGSAEKIKIKLFPQIKFTWINFIHWEPFIPAMAVAIIEMKLFVLKGRNKCNSIFVEFHFKWKCSSSVWSIKVVVLVVGMVGLSLSRKA